MKVKTVVTAASSETQHSRRDAWLTRRGDSGDVVCASGLAVTCPGVVARTMSCMSNQKSDRGHDARSKRRVGPGHPGGLRK